MNKLSDLRAYLLKQVPALAMNPERLLLFVENGSIRFHKSEPQNYSHRYTMPISLIVTDWQGSVDPLVIAICEWLVVREPGFDPENTLSFESEILAQDKIDIQFRINITERVIVTYDTQTQQREITHVLPDPQPQLQMNSDAQWNLGSEEEP